MKQYLAIKGKHPDALLLFRVGDFYETFGQDAIKASQILGIVLTKRANGSASHVELAGFPHHSLDTYLPKLVRAGQRVAICDQLEDPKLTKTIVKRGVTELVTPGVTMNDQILKSKTNNFLASVFTEKNIVGVAFADVSTGEFLVAEGSQEYVDKIIQSFSPSEIIFPKKIKQTLYEWLGTRFYQYGLDDWNFQFENSYEVLTHHFKTSSLKGFGIEDMPVAVTAAGAILKYLRDTQHDKIQHITAIARIVEDTHVWMDRFTIQNLELFRSNAPDGVLLLDVLDKTATPMGGRMLKRWLALPLKDVGELGKRHAFVAHFKNKTSVSDNLTETLSQVYDLERLVSKIATARINPREILALHSSIKSVKHIKQLLDKQDTTVATAFANQLEDLSNLENFIAQHISPEAPVSIQKGNVINSGINSELDNLRDLLLNGKNHLESIQRNEAERTGISSLKIAFNNVFGYYLEVTNKYKNKGLVPDDWVRKQTLSNAERYITDELKVLETKILSAEEKILELEESLFAELVEALNDYILPVQLNGTLIAQIDCTRSFKCNASSWLW